MQNGVHANTAQYLADHISVYIPRRSRHSANLYLVPQVNIEQLDVQLITQRALTTLPFYQVFPFF